MATVTVNPPRTPVTKGSQGMAAATMPNVCKMPGPPAPFVPTPLPNIGQSGDSLTDCTTTVFIEGNEVAIKGSSFKSQGDMASKGTGGGLVSATTHGSTKFAAPGSMNVKAEGKNIQLLGDAMTNNNSNPPNSGTVALAQASGVPAIEDALKQIAEECEEEHGNLAEDDPELQQKCKELGKEKHKCCAEKIDAANKQKGPPPAAYSEPAYNRDGSMIGRQNPGGVPAMVPRTQGAITNQAKGFFKSGNSPFSTLNGAIGAFCRGKKFPDVVIPIDPTQPPVKGNVAAVFDFKFPCPKGKKPKWGRDRQSGASQGDFYNDMLSPSQPPSMIP